MAEHQVSEPIEVDTMITDRIVRESGHEDTAVIPPGGPGTCGLSDWAPLRYDAALWALAGCVVSTAGLLCRRRTHLPAEQVGRRLRFADGTSAQVYRETVVGRGAREDPCMLVVEFRLRVVRGWAHAAFRWESLLNTPLFVSFPGFVSKLWLANDERGRYRACMSGTGRSGRTTTRVRCGGCSRWYQRRDRFTTWCCRGCAVTDSSRGRRHWPERQRGGASWWRPVAVA